MAGFGYLADARLPFFCGLLGGAIASGPALVALGRGRLPRLLLRLGLALSSFSFFLLLAELVLAAAAALHPPAPLPRAFTYDQAIADPAAFLRWWQATVGRGVMTLRGFTMPDPRGRNPYVLAPGRHDSPNGEVLQIDQLGFRGREIERDKGDVFRIVTLGESTTFDVLLQPGDRTWSELLEARIADELACDRPVEVVNGGVPGWTIANQVKRLQYDVLSLSPDLLISYHGINGFHFLFGQIPELVLRDSPAPPPRASLLLGRLESALRVAWFRRRYQALQEVDASVADANLLRTPYANQYRQLVEQAHAAGAQVALCSFNMAVNADSPEQAIRLYELLVPDVRARILANRLHNRLVRELAHSFGALYVDTSRDLDGAYRDAYIDVAHFTQAGRERMAANVLDGLRAALRDHPRLHCRPRAEAAAREP